MNFRLQGDYDKKPSTPDNIYKDYGSNISTLKNAQPRVDPRNTYGTIKRSSSKSKNENPNERPSTAPQKENENRPVQIKNNPVMKRLPSPNIKCKILNF